MKQNIIILLLYFPMLIQAQYQERQNLNANWSFQLAGETNWESVNLPHTWNAEDALDDEPGYFRGIGNYQNAISIDKKEGENYFLFFEGVNQQLKVKVNGQTAGEHIGGYTSFGFRITDLVIDGNNRIQVEVSNKHNPAVIPLEADFTFFGGIYRDVWLLTTGQAFFDYSYGQNGGIKLTPQIDGEAKGELTVEARILNSYASFQDIVFRTILYSPDGKKVMEKENPIPKIDKRQVLSPRSRYHFYDELQLWSPKNPNLYTVVSTLEQPDGKVLDRVSQKIGFRTFSFKNDGLELNGEKLKLIGSNRHQDELGKGFAISNNDHERDLKMLKEMGINFLRISHYPQDPRILELTDSLGLIAVEEIPFVNEATVSDQFSENTKQMLREMISRDRNHTSLFAWGTSNELTLRLNSITKEFSEAQKQEYINFEVKLLNELNEIIQESDETRPSFTVLCCGKERNKELGYHAADIIGYNKYFGWYEGETGDLDEYLNNYAQLESKPFFLSEYGAGADPRIRSEDPQRFDFSVEWQNHVHQSHLIQILDSDNLFGSAVWNFADFQAEHRNDAVPKINSKGVTTVHRLPKDSYYFYEVALSDVAKVRLPAKLYTQRTGVAEKDGFLHQSIEIYSNQATAELFLNDESLGSKDMIDFKAKWDVPFREGKNVLVAKSPLLVGSVQDSLTVYSNILPYNFSESDLSQTPLAINVGAHFSFAEELNSKQIWLPDQEYDGNTYGYKGGKKYFRDGKELTGSAANILTTDLDPVYQTHRYNLDSYHVNLPEGNYMVELHFAEVLGEWRTENFLKNINEDRSADSFQRIMDLTLNGEEINPEPLYDSSKENLTPIVIKKQIEIKDGGLNLNFQNNSEFNYLSGIRIKKL